MHARLPLLLLTVLLTAFALPAEASSKVRLEVDVLDSSDKDRDTIDSSKYGAGKKEVQEVKFTLEVVNRSFSEVEGLTAKVYIFGYSAFEDAVSRNVDYQLAKTFETEPFAVKYNEEKMVDLGTVTFASSVSSKASSRSVTTYFGGSKYGGWAVEVMHQGEVILTDYRNSDCKKAYRRVAGKKKNR
ncbi:MAG: hypothetical protein AAGK14_13540 [Verrucomicrobiota bacterium]